MNKKLVWMTLALSLLAALAVGCAAPAAAEPAVVDNTGPASEPAGSSADSQPAVDPTDAPAADESAPETSVEADASMVVENTKLNLNQATGDDYLATIPGFSDRMVREFLEYRPYISIQQFRREIGKYVDEGQVAEWEQYVYVPVDVNESDAETLMQIPGVDDTAAAALMDGRPYDSNDAFLAAQANHVSADDLAAAAGYLANN